MYVLGAHWPLSQPLFNLNGCERGPLARTRARYNASPETDRSESTSTDAERTESNALSSSPSRPSPPAPAAPCAAAVPSSDASSVQRWRERRPRRGRWQRISWTQLRRHEHAVELFLGWRRRVIWGRGQLANGRQEREDYVSGAPLREARCISGARFCQQETQSRSSTRRPGW